METKRFAAIDIGSNAVRMLIMTVIDYQRKTPHFKKTSLVRVPIRLGEDVFVNGKVSDEKINRLEDAMKSFRLLMDSFPVKSYKACATSAMRDAENNQEIVKRIRQNTGISIEIINGNHEAEYIASTDLQELIKSNKNYLYVDVGGGSTEFTVYSQGKVLASKSYNIGTIRMLNDLVEKKLWKKAKKWVKKNTKDLKKIKMIGTGGNINHIYKRSDKKYGKPLKLKYLSSYYQWIKTLTYEERVAQLDMKLDRADVIVPAAKIYLSAMKWSKAKKIYVPKIGLADGIIKHLYKEDKAQSICEQKSSQFLH